MSLLLTVERHLRQATVTPSRFGREVAGDPRFVFDLRRGREPRPATRERVLAYIESRRQIPGKQMVGKQIVGKQTPGTRGIY